MISERISCFYFVSGMIGINDELHFSNKIFAALLSIDICVHRSSSSLPTSSSVPGSLQSYFGSPSGDNHKSKSRTKRSGYQSASATPSHSRNASLEKYISFGQDGLSTNTTSAAPVRFFYFLFCHFLHVFVLIAKFLTNCIFSSIVLPILYFVYFLIFIFCIY